MKSLLRSLLEPEEPVDPQAPAPPSPVPEGDFIRGLTLDELDVIEEEEDRAAAFAELEGCDLCDDHDWGDPFCGPDHHHHHHH